ncbi:MAG: methyltransferase [Candidatus Peribacteraceae bacterium]|nr:methyltransferase [Candidatus Peribacteraceae bacterium]
MISKAMEIGAIAPSSKILAKAMVDFIDRDKPGLIVELGAGFGAITDELIRQNYPQERLVIFEIQKLLVNKLHAKYPRATIFDVSAENMYKYLKDKSISTIISSLPLRSLPDDVVNRIGKSIIQISNPGTRYIQFTYDLRTKNKTYFKSRLNHVKSKIVPLNIPPARVDVFVR